MEIAEPVGQKLPGAVDHPGPFGRQVGADAGDEPPLHQQVGVGGEAPLFVDEGGVLKEGGQDVYKRQAQHSGDCLMLCSARPGKASLPAGAGGKGLAPPGRVLLHLMSYSAAGLLSDFA